MAARQAKAAMHRENIMPAIRDVQEMGVMSLRGIATELNARVVATPRGGLWSAVQVHRTQGGRLNDHDSVSAS